MLEKRQRFSIRLEEKISSKLPGGPEEREKLKKLEEEKKKKKKGNSKVA